MSEGVSIRLAPIHEVDLVPVSDLVNRAFRKYRHLWIGERTSPTEYLDEAGPDARIILVERAGQLVATSMVTRADRFIEPTVQGPAGTERKVAETTPADHPWVGAMYYGFAGVEPHLMNGGFGRIMIGYVEQLAREEGFATVALGTVREFGLVDYYERFDYQVVHEELFPAGHWDFVVPHNYCEMVKRV